MKMSNNEGMRERAGVYLGNKTAKSAGFHNIVAEVIKVDRDLVENAEYGI